MTMQASSQARLALRRQGFEAFARHQGQARLVVGADLDPADVSAILKGEEARRDAALLAALGFPDDWPAEVRDGVALLAWMVARQRINVRLGLSQEKLGEAIGLTFQQVQKYERGANRIGASRLHDLAMVSHCFRALFSRRHEPGLASCDVRRLGDFRCVVLMLIIALPQPVPRRLRVST